MTTLRDALYNTHPDSGTHPKYAQGVVVGVTAALMSKSMDFHEALAELYRNLPAGFDRSYLPEGWAIYLVITHKKTKRQYAVNRNYGLIGPTNQLPLRGIPTDPHVDHEEAYAILGKPDWTRGLEDKEFVGHWLF